jgi:hypothetical protein
MHEPASHSVVIRSVAAPSLMRASVAQRVGIAFVLVAALWIAVFWALAEIAP